MLKFKPGEQHVWHADSCCFYLASHIGSYNIVVMLPKPGQKLVRFLVLHQDDDDGAEALVGSGTKEDLPAAMKAAGQMAVRLTGEECPSLSSPDRRQPVRVERGRAEKLLWQPVRTSVQT